MTNVWRVIAVEFGKTPSGIGSQVGTVFVSIVTLPRSLSHPPGRHWAHARSNRHLSGEVCPEKTEKKQEHTSTVLQLLQALVPTGIVEAGWVCLLPLRHHIYDENASSRVVSAHSFPKARPLFKGSCMVSATIYRLPYTLFRLSGRSSVAI